MTPRWLTAVVACVALIPGIVISVGATGAIAAEESYPVPDDGVFDLTGRGFGHGAGMSQYGAKGGAEAGATATTILQTYYPGTAKLDVGNPAMRVVLTRQGAESTTCSSAPPSSGRPCFRIRATSGVQVRSASGSWLAVPTSIDGHAVAAYAVTRDSSTTLAVWLYRNSQWRQWGPSGSAGPIDFKHSGGSALTLQYPDDTERAYRNTLRALRTGTTTLARVSYVSMEEYLRGVVPAEMPASWPTAAVQAQAIAARTYSYAARQRDVSADWHLCDSTACQVYGGVASESSAATPKISGTAGHVRVHNGTPITAFFSSSDGGWTIDGGASYLPARRDAWDPVNRWSRGISASCLEGKYAGGRGSLIRFVVVRRDGHGQWNGRVRAVRLEFVGGAVTVTGNGTPFNDDSAIRRIGAGCGEAAGLRSSWFTMTSAAQPPSGPGVAGKPGTTGEADVVTRTSDGSVVQREWSPAAGFESTTALGGSTGFEPAAVARPGRLDVFVTGTNGALYVRSRISGTWSPGWTSLGGSLDGRPSATVSGGTVNIVATAPNGTIAHGVLNATSTAVTWSSLGGLAAPGTAPSVSSAGSGTLDVVVQGRDSAVWSRHQRGGIWGIWRTKGGIVRGDPAVVSGSNGTFTILAVVPTGALYVRTGRDHTDAGAWSGLGGALDSSPSAYATTGRVDVLAEGTNGALYHIARTASGWSGWSRA